jgi:hypothetical protein
MGRVGGPFPDIGIGRVGGPFPSGGIGLVGGPFPGGGRLRGGRVPAWRLASASRASRMLSLARAPSR